MANIIDRRKADKYKTVYVVFRGHRFEVDLLAVFTSRKKAEKFCVEYNQVKGKENAFVCDEYKLNDRRMN